jgi:hypothetical protein
MGLLVPQYAPARLLLTIATRGAAARSTSENVRPFEHPDAEQGRYSGLTNVRTSADAQSPLFVAGSGRPSMANTLPC